MTTIAILGANGHIARIAEGMLLAHDDIELTLFIHSEDELGADIKDNPRVTIVKGGAKNADDVLNVINGATRCTPIWRQHNAASPTSFRWPRPWWT